MDQERIRSAIASANRPYRDSPCSIADGSTSWWMRTRWQVWCGSPCRSHRPLLGQEQPAQASAIGLEEVHLTAQGGGAAGAGVAGARELNHQIGAEGRKAATLVGGEGLPAVDSHEGDIGAEPGAIRQAEAAWGGRS